MMRSRGFTVLEVMMALGLLGVILALALPAVADRLTSRDLDRVAAQIDSAVSLARSQSRESGVPVAIRARRDADAWRLETRRVPAGSVAGLLPEEADRTPASTRTPDVEAGADWALALEIDAGFGLTRNAPTPTPQSAESPASASFVDEPLADAPFDLAEADVILFGVFLPGGRCAAATEINLSFSTDEAAQTPPTVRLTLSPWTGRLIRERMTPALNAEIPDVPDALLPATFDSPGAEVSP